MRNCFFLILLLVGIPSNGVAQQAPGTSVVRPVQLLPGLGNHHHAIATKSPEAQKFFDQGLALAWAFNRAEAERSFRRAAELDPSAAMPWWGVSFSLGRHMNMDLDQDVDAAGAFAAIEKARSLMGSAPENERAYIEALGKRCSGAANQDGARLDDEYASAMRQLATRYPDDLDAQTLFADSLLNRHRYHWYSAEGHPEEGSEETLAVLTSVILRDPEHYYAHHLYVHELDTSPHPEYALDNAHALHRLTPGAGHLVHMGGHIFMSVGDLEMAARVNEEAAAADRDLFKRAPASDVYVYGYYCHNLHFIVRSRTEQGLYTDARQATDLLVNRAADGAASMTGMSDYYLPNRLFLLLRFARWDDVLAEPAPDSRMIMTAALRHYARALAYAGKGDRARSLEEQQAFSAARAAIPQQTMFMFNPADKIMNIAALVLEARLATNANSAIPIWQRAVEAQDALSYDEPPAWYYWIRQSLGAALLRSGRAADAEPVFREGLRRSPRNPRLLFGLWKCLEAQGRSSDAGWVQREFAASWRGGDPASSLHIEDF
jgi:tetratricopeptide (TPR) repeat protein